MVAVAALMAALMWIGGWIALIMNVPAVSTEEALLACGVIHFIIVFACCFWYSVFNS